MKKLFALTTLVLAMVFSTEATAQEFSKVDPSPMDIASFPTSYKDSNKKVRVIIADHILKEDLYLN